MRAIYTLSIFIYRIAIGLAAPFNTKARLWLNGRKNWEKQLAQQLNKGKGPIIWMHCASLGEFEQGRPILEALRIQKPEHRLLLTFFSPSGYEVRKNYSGADIICYLPADTPRNAKRFISLVQPEVSIFIKYEFWLNYLYQLRQRKLPHLLVAGIFRPSQPFFKPWGKIFRDALRGYTHLFVQDDVSEKLLSQLGLKNFSAGGDPRFDRVTAIANQHKDLPIAEAFVRNSEATIVAGSTWPADEQLLIPALSEQLKQRTKLLIAPHELGESHLKSIEQLLADSSIPADKVIRYSVATPENVVNCQVLIIDNIGMLSALYHFGTIAYIGGGFGKSIHNTLEAAVFSIPVIFGPKHEKFNEALGLLASGGGFCVRSLPELKTKLHELLNDTSYAKQAGQKAGEYVKKNTGATAAVMQMLMH